MSYAPPCYYAIPPLIDDDLGMRIHGHTPHSPDETTDGTINDPTTKQDDYRDEVKFTRLALFYSLSRHYSYIAIPGCTTTPTPIVTTSASAVHSLPHQRKYDPSRGEHLGPTPSRLYLPIITLVSDPLTYSSPYSPNPHAHYLSTTSSISLANYPRRSSSLSPLLWTSHPSIHNSSGLRAHRTGFR